MRSIPGLMVALIPLAIKKYEITTGSTTNRAIDPITAAHSTSQ
ncbi:hypothetical protein [Bacillus pumilus]